MSWIQHVEGDLGVAAPPILGHRSRAGEHLRGGGERNTVAADYRARGGRPEGWGGSPEHDEHAEVDGVG